MVILNSTPHQPDHGDPELSGIVFNIIICVIVVMFDVYVHLSLSLYIYIYIHVYLYYIHTHIMCMYVYIYIYIYIYIHGCMHTHLHACDIRPHSRRGQDKRLYLYRSDIHSHKFVMNSINVFSFFIEVP